MPAAQATNEILRVNAFRGDAKTLLAFDLLEDRARVRLAGFTIEVRPPSGCGYFVDNDLRLPASGGHAQVHTESPFASVNAPIQQFRWVHVPGLVHQNGSPTLGAYRYVVTPRYFSGEGTLLGLDPAASVAVDVEAGPVATGEVELGFTRGYVQAQGFSRRFGRAVRIRPESDELLFDTGAEAGANRHGDTFTYAELYQWLGATARRRVIDLIAKARDDPGLRLDVTARELDEPDLCAALLELGAAGRARIVLDDDPSRHDGDEPSAEDRFAALFDARTGGGALRRRRVAPGEHATTIVVSDDRGPRSVLTGSVGLSVAGMYVDPGHVVVTGDRIRAAECAASFERTWTGTQDLALPSGAVESGRPDGGPPCAESVSPAGDSVFFALHGAGLAGRVREALGAVGSGGAVVYGVEDMPARVALFTPDAPAESLATGDRGITVLPDPFGRVARRTAPGMRHDFVVRGFRGPRPAVFGGSAPAGRDGEAAILDAAAATAFVVEALVLADHYRFVHGLARRAGTAPALLARYPDKRMVAVNAGWLLDPTDGWAAKYFDDRDPHHRERELFGH